MIFTYKGENYIAFTSLGLHRQRNKTLAIKTSSK